MHTHMLFRRYRIPFGLPGLLAGFLLMYGCGKFSTPDLSIDPKFMMEEEPQGEEYLIAFVDELDQLADAGPGVRSTMLPVDVPQSAMRRTVIRTSAADTTFVYGELTPTGLGAVVTERHQYPKGILLITVRKTHGLPGGGVVSQTKKYITFADLSSDNPQQSTITEVAGLSGDTILTHVVRNGILETYTFRLPVVTRVVNPADGSVRVTSRFGAAGAVVSEVRDGSGSLIQLRRNNGLADGSIVSYTHFADSTWRNVRTVGEADGTVFREITSGP